MGAADTAIIDHVVKRTRTTALGQLAMSVVASVVCVLGIGRLYPTVTIIAVSLNVLGAIVLARRAWRLRASGPVVNALRERPEDIASIQQWPLKLPANQRPLTIEIRTRTGGFGALLLDRKSIAEADALVAALRRRAPTADVVYSPTT